MAHLDYSSTPQPGGGAFPPVVSQNLTFLMSYFLTFSLFSYLAALIMFELLAQLFVCFFFVSLLSLSIPLDADPTFYNLTRQRSSSLHVYSATELCRRKQELYLGQISKVPTSNVAEVKSIRRAS